MSRKTKKSSVLKRAGGNCEYCKSPGKYSTEAFCLDHIIPLSKGGTDGLDNLALSCHGCNGHKYNKTEDTDPASGKKAGLFHPRKQSWKNHFVWNEDATKILGLTPSGRATAESLKLNRPNLQSLRKLLFGAGEHPPDEE